MQDVVIHGIVLAVYLIGMLSIGLFFFKKNEGQEDYLLGGRTMNPYVTAMSAQASDMSGWLLLGLPGTAFLLGNGLSDSFWTAIGLAVGTYVNWLVLAKRLRKYTQAYNNSITIPSYLENRFKDKSHMLRVVSAVFIIIFFLIYTAAQFSAGGKLFESVFGLDYRAALVIGALIIVSYTFLGGYKAVCWTDFFQGCLMFAALVLVTIVAVADVGGVSEVNAVLVSEHFSQRLLSFDDWVGLKTYGILGIVSSLAWGLGYFGQPHIITRFMGIRKSGEIKPARRVAMIWVTISLACAVVLGVVGKAYLSLHMNRDAFSSMDSEKVFIEMIKIIFQGPGWAIIAGALLTAILAAIMSTADSQLLVTSSAVSEDIYKAVFKREATAKQLMWVSRITVIAVTIVAALMAMDPNSSVFGLVSYAWAGFGAAFGPAILMSLYWKRMNVQGAVAGVISGGVTVLVWKNFIKPHFALYELLPAFIISFVFIVIVTMITNEPEKEISDEFDRALESDV